MSQQIRQVFDEIAPTYDRLNHLLSVGLDRHWRRRAVKMLTGCRRVLDLCAGTLDMSLELLQHSPQTTIDAVDFSQEMLELGEKKLSPTQRSQIKLHCADALELPFTGETFDGAMVAYGMRNLDDNERGLKEVGRVLKAGARFVILEFFRPEHFKAKLFYHTYGRWVIPMVGRCLSHHRGAYRYLTNSIKTYYSADEFADLMIQNSFVQVEFHHLPGGASTLISGVKA